VGALPPTWEDAPAVHGDGNVALEIPVNVEADRLTLKDAAEMIRQHYTANGRKSADTMKMTGDRTNVFKRYPIADEGMLKEVGRCWCVGDGTETHQTTRDGRGAPLLG
jgi:hypothetical protein